MTFDNHETQNVALVYLEQPQHSVDEEVAELKELIRSAYGEVKLFIKQSRNFADPKTLIGSGKVTELKLAIETADCDIKLVIFSQKLDSLQRKNLQEQLEIDVIDNIDLILDIFALRATSAEGKKQVELAQLSYRLATRSDKNFSRQGGGIGTRGPGETQLETDKRLLRSRMHRLREELAEIEKQRAVMRKKRLENKIFTVALVGYTNAGKSTLFNRLTNNNVYADDRLFATLDTTVRKTVLNGIEVLFCDTVGFIRNLPTTLIEAFKSTLEEASTADLILNVCDISNPDVERHIEVTEQILSDLDFRGQLVRVYNKCDKDGLAHTTLQLGPCVFISAKTGKNIDVLLEVISQYVMRQYTKVCLKVPFVENGKIASLLQKHSISISVEYTDDSCIYAATIKRSALHLFSQYLLL